MATIECTNDQLRLIQKALELYSKIAILEFEHILKYHPAITTMVEEQFRPKNDILKVGYFTERGVVVEIGNGYIDTYGSWGRGYETRRWTDVEDVKSCVDYDKCNDVYKKVKDLFNQAKVLITGDIDFSIRSTSSGIHNEQSANIPIRVNDIIQIIRNELYKA